MSNVVIVTPFFLPRLNGIAFSTLSHGKSLSDLGFNVYIISNSKFDAVDTFYKHIHIPIYGSGLPWNPVRGKKNLLHYNLSLLKPEYIFIEGWYSWGSHLVKFLKKYCNRIVLISHGSKYVTNDFNIIALIKKIGYFIYDYLFKKRTLKFFSAITLLSDYEDSARFNEVRFCKLNKIKYFILPNIGIINSKNKPHVDPKKNFNSASLAIIGEMCINKNQIGLMSNLINSTKLKRIIFYYPSENSYSVKLKEIYNNNGKIKIDYFVGYNRDQILTRINTISLLGIGSYTEAQPLVLLDSISIGIPFVSTKVGCISSIDGGLLSDMPDFFKSVDSILSDYEVYQDLSNKGLNFYQLNHSSQAMNIIFKNITNELSQF